MIFEGVTVCVCRGDRSTVVEVRADVWLTRCEELARVIGHGARFYAFAWPADEDDYGVWWEGAT